VNEVQGQAGEVCSQCHHVAVMLLKGEQQFYEGVKEKAKKRLDNTCGVV